LTAIEKHPQLLSAGGRVFLGDLQPVLNVDAFHIEKAAAELAQEVRVCAVVSRVVGHTSIDWGG
jgi:hypothetical protein